MARPLFLVGMMGSGKSRVGRELALRVGASFCDLDRRIELVFGVSIAALLGDGEPRLRAREHDALRTLVEEPGFGGRAVVVATGGGAAIDPRNRALMRSSGVVVWLDVPLAILAERLRDEIGDRPLLADRPLAPRLAELWAAREPAYRAIGLAVDGTGTVDEVTTRVHALWLEQERAWTPG
jgi:shikimate kinase